MSYKLAIIGLGNHAHRYARHLIEGVHGLELVAACRRAPDAADREKLGNVPIVTDYRELLDRSRVDGVIISSPARTHEVITVAALEAGIPVLLEKPVTHDEPSSRRVVDAVRRTRVPLIVAQTLRYEPVFRHLVEEARSAPGPIRVNVLHASNRGTSVSRGDSAVPGHPGVGAFVETGVHFFDLARLMLGLTPITVTASADPAPPDEIAFTAHLRNARGSFTLEVMRNAAAIHERFEMELGDRLLAVRRFEQVLEVRRGKDVERAPFPPPAPAIPQVLQDFLQTLRTGEIHGVSAAEGCANLAIADACSRSAREGRAVTTLTP